MSNLTWLKTAYGRSNLSGEPFSIGFDLSRINRTSSEMYNCLKAGQLWDAEIVRTLIDILQPGDSFIDIGGHIGYFSLLARQMVGDTGKIYAFEANPETYLTLLSSVLTNRYSNVFAINCALSDRVGIANFASDLVENAMSSLSREIYGRREEDIQRISVLTSTLDVLYQQLAMESIRSVKIDVEGFETAVISGGRQFFSKLMPENVVFEINNACPGVEKGYDLGIRQFFSELGYRSYLLKPSHGERTISNWDEAKAMWGGGIISS